jgi:hypothetical protein
MMDWIIFDEPEQEEKYVFQTVPTAQRNLK